MPLRPPLHQDESGAIRVGGTRVALESVLIAFQRGSTPEEIVEQYPALDLKDVYLVIGYYLCYRSLFDAYLREMEREANELFERLEQSHPTAELRERICQRAQQLLQQRTE